MRIDLGGEVWFYSFLGAILIKYILICQIVGSVSLWPLPRQEVDLASTDKDSRAVAWRHHLLSDSSSARCGRSLWSVTRMT